MANKTIAETIVVYPESMHKNFFSILEEYKIPFCYILHDKDTDTNGKIKKAHYHVVIERKLTAKETEIVYKYGVINYKEPVRSEKGITNYLTHENNPNKFHYNMDAVNYSKHWDEDKWDEILSKQPQKEVTCTEIFTVIIENDIDTYNGLIKYAMSNLSDAHVNLIVKRAYAFKEFMRG